MWPYGHAHLCIVISTHRHIYTHIHTHTHTHIYLQHTHIHTHKIGRASCGERVEISVGAVSLKKKNTRMLQQRYVVRWRTLIVCTAAFCTRVRCLTPDQLSLHAAQLLPHSYPFFFFSSRRRHTRFKCDWSSDVCSSD